jgi:ribosomal protein S18 acetylase RimI-like enzyme
MEEIVNSTYLDVKKELFRLKSKDMRTNFFMTESQFDNQVDKITVFKTEKACFLLTEDNGFYRLNFIISEAEALQPIFEYCKLHSDKTISVETVGNFKYLENVRQVFLENDFYEYSSMVRMSRVRQETKEVDLTDIHLLTTDKKREIEYLYNKHFDKFVERIPTTEEIDNFIDKKMAYYFSDNDEIQGFIVFEPHGITSHLRYWFVHPNYREKKIGSKLIQLFFNIGEGVKRELFWVIKGNQNAIKRYKHFGFFEEDMQNLIFINKDRKYEEQNY